MNEALIIFNVLLALAVLALTATVLALSRQIGILHERIAPMGALIIENGPKVGQAAPLLTLTTLDGRTLQIGVAAPYSTLLFFLSPTCPVCKKLLPIIKSIRRDELSWLRVVLASDGEATQHETFRRSARLLDFPYVLSTELGMTFKISKLPYAVLIDESGRVRAKGLVNSREQLESLFAARELGVGSIQEYLDHSHQTPPHQPLAEEVAL